MVRIRFNIRAGYLSLVVALILPADPAPAEPTFTAPYRVVPSGAPGGGLSIADVDGDGLPDLVNVGTSSACEPACGSQSELVVSAALVPPGSGFPSAAGSIWFSGDGGSIAVGDLNGDRRADIVMADRDRTHIFLGRSGGGFDLEATYTGRYSEGPVAIADFNGDGKADFIEAFYHLVSVPSADRGFLVYLGHGDGTFSRNESPIPGNGLSMIADLNRDSRLDLVLASGGITVLFGTGDGRFVPGPVTPGIATPLDLADFNNDHLLDVLVEGGVVLGRGDGTFGLRIDNGAFGRLSVADLNEDGRLDLVAGRDRVTVLLGNGDGSFVTGATYFPGEACNGILAYDLDRDGHVDIATSARAGWTGRDGGTIFIFPGHGDGTFGDGGVHPVAEGPAAIAVADLNHDGNPDVAVAGGPSRVVGVLLGSASGHLEPAGSYPTNGHNQSIVIEDLDLDGTLDLVVVSRPRILVFRGRGDGSFLPATELPADGWASSVVAGDFNQDGRPDLAVGNETPGSLSVFLGTANGFQPRVDVPAPRNLGPIATADYSGDGHLDVAAGGYGAMTMFRGLGDGRFQLAEMDESPHYCEDESFLSVTAYRRGDNCRPEIAVGWSCCSYDSPRMYCRFSTAFMRFGPRGTLEWNGLGGSAGSPILALAAGDLSGDGLDDLAGARLPGAISVEIADGAGGLQPSQLVGTGGNPIAVAIADMNADGRLDIVTANSGSSTVTVHLNRDSRLSIPGNPMRVVASPGDASIGLSWEPVVHPGLSAYRIHYGRSGSDPSFPGRDAAEGSSPLTVPASSTSVTLTCLAESLYMFRITAVDREGRESSCASTTAARPLPAGGTLHIAPRNLNDASHGRWITATIDLGPTFTADDAIAGTIRINGIPAEPRGAGERQSGSILRVRFPRAEVARTLGSPAVLTAEGMLSGCSDTIRFVARDTLGADRERRGPPVVDGSFDADTDTDTAPLRFRVYSMTPNPAVGGCEIGFDLPADSRVTLQVFDVTGRRVGAVLDRSVPAGRQVARWDAAGLAGGLYFVRLEAGPWRSTLRVVLAH